ncbi:MAG: DUF2393 domain-containing protein [Acidobacteria bacterium]|nr:DUF2393 domain-containing protein [Acidobacteriota bacterium]
MTHSESLHDARRLSLLARRICHRPQRSLIAVSLAMLSLAGCSNSQRSTETSKPTAAEAAYLQNIEITSARMTAATNFLQQTVVTLHARVTNKGNQMVRYLELDLAFSNFMGQVDLRQKADPINTSTPPLKPGETRAFEVSFDNIPADWNQTPPQITPTRVALGGNH